MVEIRETDEFSRWFARLRDQIARAQILVRIRRLSLGNPGDVRPVGRGISELRIDWGPGYRVYYVMHRSEVVVLLCGGDKSDQQRDIATAKRLATQLEY
ncbi:type II toxin-antitoxin system RelE/ParE family toxin [Beijerinckia sp. L45]|uniref:type II toxin-antitoxin system RelE/ParE family toxin n=1 Tax=Beijerinckia sp. L45 TaxID=1641855 RepID=UPI00131C86A2|nr:type II toxin-antitoxin system RelE/ParE family toxin [Beijerinckia sp. L45]